MKKVFLVSWFCLAFYWAKAQTFQSAFIAESLYNIRTTADSQGNFILTGFVPALTSHGDSMVYRVIKYTPQGLELWRTEIASPFSFNVSATVLNDKFYAVGNYRDKLYVANSYSPGAGGDDLFYLSIDQNGVANLKTEGGTGIETFNGLCTLNGYLYAVGTVSGNIIFNNSTNSYSATQAFMEKLDSSFSPVWIKWATETNNNRPSLDQIKTSNGHLYAYGAAKMLWDQGPTIGTYNYNLLRFDSSGNYLDEFPNINGAMYHSSVFFAEGPANEIAYLNCEWGSKGLYYSAFLVQKGDKSEKWGITMGKVTCSDQFALLENGAFFWCNDSLNATDYASGKPIKKIPLSQPQNFLERYFTYYTGDKLIFYGRFNNSITLGNSTLVSANYGNAFVSVINSDVVLSTGRQLRDNPTIFPSPVENILKLESNNSISGSEITIFSITGAELLKLKVGQSDEIDVSAFQTGIYILKIEKSKEVHILRFVKL
jgi:hypothetical protein